MMLLKWGVGEESWESPGCKEIKPANPNGNQSWILIGRTDAEAEAPILWPPDAKNWLTGKDPDAGKDWKQEEKGTTEDEILGWHHWLNGHEFEQAPGVGDGQGGLACCRPWGHRVGYNWETELNLWFSSVNLSYVNLIMRPAIEPRRKEGNFFCPIDSYIGMLWVLSIIWLCVIAATSGKANRNRNWG